MSEIYGAYFRKGLFLLLILFHVIIIFFFGGGGGLIIGILRYLTFDMDANSYPHHRTRGADPPPPSLGFFSVRHCETFLQLDWVSCDVFYKMK